MDNPVGNPENCESGGRAGRRVLFLSPSAGKFTGGPSANTANFMKSSAFDEFDVRLIDTAPPPVPYGHVKRSVRSAQIFADLARAIFEDREHRPEAAYIQASTGLGFLEKVAMAEFCQACGVGVVLHLVSGRIEEFVGESRLRRELVGRLLARMDTVACVGSAWTRFVQNVSPHARIAELVNPVDVSAFRNQSLSRARSRTARNVRFLFVAIMLEIKGPFDLVRAVASRKSELEGRAEFVMAGSGDDLQAVRNLIDSLGVGHLISTPGFVTEPEKVELLASSDVFVLPSHVEGLPVAVLEAMSASLPVVTTRVGAIPDAVDSSNGIVVDPHNPDKLGEALVRMVEIGADRFRMGENGRSRVLARYDTDVVGKALGRLWIESLEIRRGRGRK